MGNGEWKVSCFLVSNLFVLSHSDTSDSFMTPWSVAQQASLSMGIFQARIPEWVAMPSSKGSSWPRDWTLVSCIAGGFFTVWATTRPFYSRSFPGGSDGKESACNAGDLESIPGSGRCPGEGNGYPFLYSCLENSTDRGTWWATVHGVTKESDTTEWLTVFIQGKWKLLMLREMHLRQVRFGISCKARRLSLHMPSILKW